MLGNFRDNQPRKRDNHVGRVEGLALGGRGGKCGTQAITGEDKEGRRWAMHPVSRSAAKDS